MSYFMPSKICQDLLIQSVSVNTEGDLTNAAATELAMLKFISYKCGVNF